jgi:uncharacterized protein YlzI (FlbEa/FlbD family)
MTDLVNLLVIVVHVLDGSEVTINVEHVVSMYETKEDQGGANQLVAPGGRCVITLSNGRHYTVLETCNHIRQTIEKVKP